jgi:TonB family protein
MVNARVLRISLALATVASAVCVAAPPGPSFKQIESWIIARPSPIYPVAAVARGEAGSGVIKLHFKVKTGTVRSVEVVESTGYKALDAAAAEALSQWRFKAGVLPSIRSLNPHTKEPFADEDFVAKVPVTFALSAGGQVNMGGFGAPR